MSKSPVICLMGPTASGKTDLALAIADQFDCEIISVDSVMIYRGLDIGSAKPSPQILKQYPHHLVDILDPKETYSAASFRSDALRLIQQAHAKEKIPLLVGGTMLYFTALLHGLSQMPSANAEIRDAITQFAKQKGWQQLHNKLASIDPKAADRIHANDPQRIQRALEVYEVTGIPISDWHANTDHAEFPFKTIKLALIPQDRSLLHKRIEERFDQMLKEGFMEEMRQLFQRDELHADLPSMRAVGYRQAWKYLAGEYDAATMREKAIVATRQFAKRQLTWLRSEPSLREFSVEKLDIHDVCQEIQSYLA